MWLEDRERSDESLRAFRLAMVSGGAAPVEVFPEMFDPEDLPQSPDDGPVDFTQLQQVQSYTEEAAMDDFARLTRAMASDAVSLREGPDEFIAGALMTGDDDGREWV